MNIPKYPEAVTEALENVKIIEGLPALRICCVCKCWLDEASETVANARPQIEYILTHGLCEPCYDSGAM